MDRRSNRGRATVVGASTVDIFRGFTFRVTHFDSIGLCLVIDIVTSYVGTETLAQYLARNEFPRDLRSDGRLTRWAYDYGRTITSVNLYQIDERSISKVARGDGRNTYEYLVDKYPHLAQRISPHDRAATIIYKTKDIRDENKHYPAATTLLRPKFTNKHEQVRALGDTPAFPPKERAARIDGSLPYFQGALFAGQKVGFGRPLRVERKVLPFPGLLFGPSASPTVLRLDADSGNEFDMRKK